jgi:exopolysaccharide biosynthesis polyprenyl glycosylphosphotransferase
MLGRRQEINLQLHQLLDMALLLGCFWLSHWLRATVIQAAIPTLIPISEFSEFYWMIAVIAPFTPIFLEMQGFYTNLAGKTLRASLWQLGGAAVWIGLIIGFCEVFVHWHVHSRMVLILEAVFGGIALLAREAWVKHRLSRHLLSDGVYRERVLLAGLPGDMEHLLENMTPEQRAEVEIVGKFDITENPVSRLVELLHEGSVSRVVFAVRHVHFAKIEEAVQACETEGVEAWISADFFQTAIARPTFDVLAGKMMLVFHTAPNISWSLLLKDVVDRAGALLMLLVTLPLWLVAMVGIRLCSKGPVFFSQERCGRYGRPFRMYKFRTMHTDAEARLNELAVQNQMSGPVFKIKNDPRVFKFGKWLRRLSIDELPQLLNVLSGDMSLVGPRPLPVYEIKRIEKHAQRRRLSVKPGLTCIWQVSGRNRISSFEEWVALDLKYIDNWSLWLDAKILAQTVPAVLRGSGAC